MSTQKTPAEKRKFTRVPFVSSIQLQQGNQQWVGQVVDVSLNGILVNIDDDYTSNTDTITRAMIVFENGTQIHAVLHLSHHNQRLYGFQFDEIDSESVSHLRSLITHNLGDASACERELMTLFSYHQ